LDRLGADTQFLIILLKLSGSERTSMAKRGKTVRKPVAVRNAPTMRKRASVSVNAKKKIRGLSANWPRRWSGRKPPATS
jgi:hypothetical protein